jgi:crotonobetainyl-CoA:carnitine CoA-transferase CaiB-like acyl-CoA transferase
VIGVQHYPAEPFRLTNTALPSPRRAPYVGEHNREILVGLLGLSEMEIAALERDNVIGTAPL